MYSSEFTISSHHCILEEQREKVFHFVNELQPSQLQELLMFQAYKVEVKEPPQGMTPPTQSVVKKAPHQPSRLRKFVAKNSAGLRIRAHPSLQSEQIGIVHVNGTIAFIDEASRHQFMYLMLVVCVLTWVAMHFEY